MAWLVALRQHIEPLRHTVPSEWRQTFQKTYARLSMAIHWTNSAEDVTNWFESHSDSEVQEYLEYVYNLLRYFHEGRPPRGRSPPRR